MVNCPTCKRAIHTKKVISPAEKERKQEEKEKREHEKYVERKKIAEFKMKAEAYDMLRKKMSIFDD